MEPKGKLNDREPPTGREKSPAGRFLLSVGKHVVKRRRGKIDRRKMCCENSHSHDNGKLSSEIIQWFDTHPLVRWHK